MWGLIDPTPVHNTPPCIFADSFLMNTPQKPRPPQECSGIILLAIWAFRQEAPKAPSEEGTRHKCSLSVGDDLHSAVRTGQYQQALMLVGLNCPCHFLRIDQIPVSVKTVKHTHPSPGHIPHRGG